MPINNYNGWYVIKANQIKPKLADENCCYSHIHAKRINIFFLYIVTHSPIDYLHTQNISFKIRLTITVTFHVWIITFSLKILALITIIFSYGKRLCNFRFSTNFSLILKEYKFNYMKIAVLFNHLHISLPHTHTHTHTHKHTHTHTHTYIYIYI